MFKRNHFSNSKTSLESKIMLAAPAATLELGADVGAEAQLASEASVELQTEVGVRFDENGNIREDTRSAGDETSVFIDGEQLPGNGTIHTHPTLDGSGDLEFRNSQGQGADGTTTSPTLEVGPGGGDIIDANFHAESAGVVAAGTSTFAHVPSEEGVRAAQTDIQSIETFEVKADQLDTAGQQAFETGVKRAQSEADREAGDGQGIVSEERFQAIEDNSTAIISEQAGGASFKGVNDGSGTLVSNDPDPSIA